MACMRGCIVTIATFDWFAFIVRHSLRICFIDIVYTEIIIDMTLFHHHQKMMLSFALWLFDLRKRDVLSFQLGRENRKWNLFNAYWLAGLELNLFLLYQGKGPKREKGKVWSFTKLLPKCCLSILPITVRLHVHFHFSFCMFPNF